MKSWDSKKGFENKMARIRNQESEDLSLFKMKVESIFGQSPVKIAEKAKASYSKETMTNAYIEEYDCNGRKERILLIDVNCKNSSTGKIVYDLYTNIRKDGRKAAVCYGRGEDINEEDIYKFGIDAETNIHAALSRLTGYNACFSPISTRRLLKIIEEFKPDLIHLHEIHAYFVNLKPLINYIKEKNIPLIWTFHCEYMYTGKCGYAGDCMNFQFECGNCRSIHGYPKSLFFDRTRQMLNKKKQLLGDHDFTIVTPSNWLADRVRKSFLRDKKIKVIHNGINTDIFKPVDASDLRKQLNISKDFKIILSVAPNIMSERKGGKWVLKLADMMRNENVIFILVGGGKITHNDKRDNIIFAGEVCDQNLLAKYYSLADMFVLFSSKETFSMTCAEALCCGTPVVGYKCGAPETIFKEDEAIFFDYGEIDEVGRVVKMVMKSDCFMTN